MLVAETAPCLAGMASSTSSIKPYAVMEFDSLIATALSGRFHDDDLFLSSYQHTDTDTHPLLDTHHLLHTPEFEHLLAAQDLSLSSQSRPLVNTSHTSHSTSRRDRDDRHISPVSLPTPARDRDARAYSDSSSASISPSRPLVDNTPRSRLPSFPMTSDPTDRLDLNSSLPAGVNSSPFQFESAMHVPQHWHSNLLQHSFHSDSGATGPVVLADSCMVSLSIVK